MSQKKPVQLGLCCMNTTLKAQKPPVYAARRIIMEFNVFFISFIWTFKIHFCFVKDF